MPDGTGCYIQQTGFQVVLKHLNQEFEHEYGVIGPFR